MTYKIKSLKWKSDLQNQIFEKDTRLTSLESSTFSKVTKAKPLDLPVWKKKKNNTNFEKEEKKRHDDHQTHKVFLPTLQLSSGP